MTTTPAADYDGVLPVIAHVALPVPLPQLFDYLAPDLDDEDIGRLVRVPFGRGERIGLVLALDHSASVTTARLKPVHQCLRDQPALPADWLALVAFTADYYQAPIGEVVAMALPPRMRRDGAGQDRRSDDAWLALTMAGRAAHADGGRSGRPRRLLDQLAALDQPLRRSTIRALPDGIAVGTLVQRGWLSPVLRDPLDELGERPPLTPDQATTLDTLLPALDARHFQPVLLHGVTGSGKTEVYLRLAEAVLRDGDQVLLLVPEIALTPQLEARVSERFPCARLVSLHSGLGEAERTRGHAEARSGAAQLVLGTRLAIFTPMPRLRLIIVDEEHDASYKQQDGVRYSARDLAVWRARQREVLLVLGSATPSLESWRQARDGRYRLIRMSTRARAARMPLVTLIDLRRAAVTDGISEPLADAVEARLMRGEQSLIYLNRRGYAPVLRCIACDWLSHCPNCSAHLVLHLEERRLRCHHCGHHETVPKGCPQCGNLDIVPQGRGTQRVEATLIQRFPEARVLRLDRDAARSRAQWLDLLAQVASGEADILVGTQLMAKGHDFARLTLVGVIGADASVHAADFRAPERLFQQLMQVGGRAGRGTLPGEVLIQTEYPFHPLFDCLVAHDYDRFAAQSLAERHSAGFPPFGAMVMLRADAPSAADAMAFLNHARHLARPFTADGVMLHEPVPMRLARLAGRERAQLLAESASRPVLHHFLRPWVAALHATRTPSALRWHIDVDPQET